MLPETNIVPTSDKWPHSTGCWILDEKHTFVSYLVKCHCHADLDQWHCLVTFFVAALRTRVRQWTPSCAYWAMKRILS